MTDPEATRCLDQARASWFTATASCDANCGLYHKVRPLLRCLGLSAQPADQGKFFARSLERVLLGGAREVLICGTSDTAMPDFVKALIGKLGISARLYIIDQCATPLQLVKHHSVSSSAVDVQTYQEDILQWCPAMKFDVIITHSILGQFSSRLRPALFQKWYDLLSPDGNVITVNRVRPSGSETSFSDRGAQWLADEAARRFGRFPAMDGISLHDIHSAVVAYASERHTHPVRSIAEIEQLCHQANLDITWLVEANTTARTVAQPGPAMPDGSSYCHLIATRPA